MTRMRGPAVEVQVVCSVEVRLEGRFFPSSRRLFNDGYGGVVENKLPENGSS